MKWITTAVIFGLAPVAAAQTAYVDDVDPEVLEAARAYAALNPVDELLQEMATAFLSQIPAELHEDVERAMAGIDVVELEEMMIVTMARHFTASELRALTAFYSTPEGRAIMEKMPLYVADFLPYLQQQMLRAFEATQ